MKLSLIFACLVANGSNALAQNPPGNPPGQTGALPSPPPMAFINSQRVVYAQGEAIDLTFSVAAPKAGTLVPRFKVEREEGEIAPALQVAGKYFWQTMGVSAHGVQRAGSIAAVTQEQEIAGAKRQYVEILPDLRDWYGMVEPGFYQITFDGQWVNQGASHAVTSNSIFINIGGTGTGGAGGTEGAPIDSHEILLSDIWALEMPGTIPMRITLTQLDPPVYRAPEGQMVNEILEVLNEAQIRGGQGCRVFIVRGQGMQALQECHNVIVNGAAATSQFLTNEPLTICIAAASFEDYLHLESVVQYGSAVQVTYALVSHPTLDATSHIALIPIQFTEAGDAKVELRPKINHDDASAAFLNAVSSRMPHSLKVSVNSQ